MSHIIHKVYCEINTNDIELAHQISNNIEDYIKESVLAEIELYFEEIEKTLSGKTLRLEQLSIDLKTTESDFNLNELTAQIQSNLDKTFEKSGITPESIIQNESQYLIDNSSKNLKQYIQVLAEGTSPWWGNRNTIAYEDFTEYLQENTKAQRQLLDEIRKSGSRIRFFKQNSNEEILDLLSLLFPDKSFELVRKFTESVEQYIITIHSKELTELPPDFYDYRLFFWESVWLYCNSSRDEKKILVDIITQSILLELHKDIKWSTSQESTAEIFNQQVLGLEVEHYANAQNIILSFENSGIYALKQRMEKFILAKYKRIIDALNELNQNTQISPKISPNSIDVEPGFDTIQLSVKTFDYEKAGAWISFLKSKNIGVKLQSPLKNARHFIQETSNKTNAVISEIELKNDVGIEIQNNHLIRNEKESKKESAHQHQKFETENLDAYDHIYDNAGLILLHPFLKQLFQSCHLYDDGAKEISKREVAIHLLHYIATGKEYESEHLMPFEKFLCNWPMKEPIERYVHLSEDLKKQVGEMMHAALGHWSKMENASLDLLRSEFLERPGKLIKEGTNARLIMETRVHDILLKKLNWNVSMIKLPWKKELIFVDWNY